MTSYRIYLIASATILLISCKKEWFEEKRDKNVTVLATIQEFEMLLDALSGETPALGEIASDDHYPLVSYYSDLSSYSDPVAYAQRNAYTWSSEFPYTNSLDWKTAYSRIFSCNLALDGLRKIHPSNQYEIEYYNRVMGNALFNRAKNYFDLCQLYSFPFNANSNNEYLGIPLKEGIDITESSFRATVKQCYERIISDLIEATKLLPDRSTYPIRGSRSAAFALLARTHLTMQNYEKAAKFADSCLAIYDDLIDYNSVPVDNTIMGGRFNEEVLFYSEMIVYDFLWNFNFYVDSQLYKSYAPNDLRRSRFFIANADGSITFKGNYTDEIYYQFSGLAIDEVYLIRAECYARSGDLSNALKYLNDLLITRWDNSVPYEQVTASTQEDAIYKILSERRKELLMRGIRWSDLRRLNLDPKTIQNTLTRIVSGKPYTLEPNSYKYTFPIPQDVLELAPEMKQSPGWE